MQYKFKKSILIVLILGLLCHAQKGLSQPIFDNPIRCIPANPAEPAATSGETTYTLLANQTKIKSISALGDLEIMSVSPALPTYNDVTIKVKSKNLGRDIRNDCIGYLAGRNPIATDFGFGKAQIRVGYESGSCGDATTSLDIYKSFEETPLIIGPDCIRAGEKVTYSVCPILSVNPGIDFDTYAWGDFDIPNSITFPPGLNFEYYSSDHSSVTFTVSSNWNGGTIYCKFGQCNTGVSSKAIGIQTPAPINISVNGNTVTNLSTICLDATTSPITLSASNDKGYTYKWSTNNFNWGFGSTGSATATSASDEVVNLFAQEAGSILYLTTIGGCSSRTDTIYIKRGLTAPLTIKRTDNVICVVPGSTVTFTINNATNTANFGGNSVFNWTLPTGWSIIGNQRGPTITAQTALTGAFGGIVTVSIDGCPGTLSLPVNVKPNPPSIISGPICITKLVSPATAILTYAVTNVQPLTYTWSYTGTNLSGNSTTNTVNYLQSSNSTLTNVRVVANSIITTIPTTCTSDPSQLSIYQNPVTPVNITANRACVPKGSTCMVTFTATGSFPANSVFNWTVPSGYGTIVTTTGNTCIVNTTGSLVGTYNISVSTTVPVCGTSALRNVAFKIAPTSTIKIVNNPATGTPITQVLSIVTPPGGCAPLSAAAGGYRWYETSNPSFTLATVSSLLLQMGVPTNISVDLTFSGGCKTTLNANTLFNSRLVQGNADSSLEKTIIAPNPADNSFMLHLPSSYKRVAVHVYNRTGTLIKEQVCKGGSNNFVTTNWPNGEYLVLLTSSTGVQVTKKIIISR
jgi:hypothetical protein